MVANDRVYVTAATGKTCGMRSFDAKTGKPVWEEKLPAAFSASPGLAGVHIYARTDTGETFVFKAENTHELVARSRPGEQAQTTPAASDGRLYVRTKTKRWCVGPAAK